MIGEIWKFKLGILDSQQISMPKGAKVLSAAMQGDALCIWAVVNPKEKAVPRAFRVRGTGHEIDTARTRFIATVQSGPLVWHIFEVTP